MARPNVKFTLNDQALTAKTQEQPTIKMIGAMLSDGAQLYGLARAGETTNGYMFIPNVNDLYARLTAMVTYIAGGSYTSTTISIGECASGYINGSYSGTALDGSGQFGLCGGRTAFKEEFWALNNFLQYGSPCYVGFGFTASAHGGSGFNALLQDVIFDVIFQGRSGTQAIAGLTAVVENKKNNDQPVFGVLNVPSGLVPASSGFTYPEIFNTGANGVSGDFHYTLVYGEKTHLGANGGTDVLVTTILAPDVAGCIARTDRDYYPWYSPAGTRRGRILDVTKLTRNLTSSQQDVLFDNGINPVVTFPGEGTFLFGDKSAYNKDSTLSRINVARLFINLKKTLGSLARTTMFEQNTPDTRRAFKLSAEKILNDVLAQSGITDYKVICDESNNPQSVVKKNEFYAEVLIKPITSVNFITITLTNVDLEATINA